MLLVYRGGLTVKPLTTESTEEADSVQAVEVAPDPDLEHSVDSVVSFMGCPSYDTGRMALVRRAH